MAAMRGATKRLNEVASAVLDGLAWEAARKAVDVVRYQPRQLDLVLACGVDQPEVPLPVTRWLVEARTWPALRHLSTIPHRIVRLVAAEAARWLGPTGSAVVRWSSGAVAAAVDHAGASTLQQPLRARAHPGMLVPHPHQVAVIAVDMRGFSNLTGRVYGLMPTAAAPTMLISGLPMHRIKGTNPQQDTQAKIKAIAPITGRVLDTCTGLGYTAIEAARTAEHVITIELDPTAQEMARCTPWSRSLFDNPKISQIIGDAFEVVPSFEDGVFSCILHDPPLLGLAGELYSGEFYRDCWRVLRRNGKLFHYIGDPDSKSGARTTRGVVRRLQEAGFTRVIAKPQAFGVAAYK
jgi:predicted methyltransferase